MKSKCRAFRIGSLVATLLLPVAGAQAAAICDEGPIKTAPPSGEWSGVSDCECENISAAVMTTVGGSAALFPSSGVYTGEAWLQLEFAPVGGGGGEFWWAERTGGAGYYFITGTSGNLATSFVKSYPRLRVDRTLPPHLRAIAGHSSHQSERPTCRSDVGTRVSTRCAARPSRSIASHPSRRAHQ